MNTEQIDLICGQLDSEIRPYYQGCYSLDNYISYNDVYYNPETVNIYIVNNQNSSSKKDGHWLLISKNPNVFFCSFGKGPLFYGLENKFDEVNTIRVQGKSRICGLYCIYFASQIAKGAKMSALVKSHFSPVALNSNDSLILNWTLQQPFGYLLGCKGSQCLSFEELMDSQYLESN